MDTARSRPGAAKTSSLRPYALLLGAFAVVAGATVVFANRSDDTPELTEEAAGTPAATPPGTPPGAAAVPTGPGACTWDLTLEPIADVERLIGGAPGIGAEDAPVTVVEIFDPNCPHCKHLYDAVHGAFVEAHPQARFYYVPYPLWDFSLGQIAALRLSREEGKYFDLVEEMFARQAGRGMQLDQVVAAAEAAGMNGAELRRKLTDNATLDPLLQNILDHREFVSAAVTLDGAMSVPKVVINGRVLAPDPALGYPAECLDRLIAEAAAGPAPATTPAPAVAPPPAEQ
jgi:protein-disulfide isomerase